MKNSELNSKVVRHRKHIPCTIDSIQTAPQNYINNLELNSKVVGHRRHIPSTIDSTQTFNENVTLEDLFQMPIDMVEELFQYQKFKLNKRKERHRLIQSNGFKSKLNTNKNCGMKLSVTKYDAISSRNVASMKKVLEEDDSNADDTSDERDFFIKRCETVSLLKMWSTTSVSSKQPMRCPHDPCSKIVTASSLEGHFKHEHVFTPKYTLERGKELQIMLDASILEYGKTFCLGVITYDKKKPSASPRKGSTIDYTVNEISEGAVSTEKFWIMVSSFSEKNKSLSDVIFWLFINKDHNYQCRLELASARDIMCYSVLCSVNMFNVRNVGIEEMLTKMTCLYVPYGGIENQLLLGSKLTFTITIRDASKEVRRKFT